MWPIRYSLPRRHFGRFVRFGTPPPGLTRWRPCGAPLPSYAARGQRCKGRCSVVRVEEPLSGGLLRRPRARVITIRAETRPLRFPERGGGKDKERDEGIFLSYGYSHRKRRLKDSPGPVRTRSPH